MGHENRSAEVLAERLRQAATRVRHSAYALSLRRSTTHHQSGSASRRSPAGHVAPRGHGLHVPPATRLNSLPLHGLQERASAVACLPGGQGAMLKLPGQRGASVAALEHCAVVQNRTGQQRQRRCSRVQRRALDAHGVRGADAPLCHQRIKSRHTCGEQR